MPTRREPFHNPSLEEPLLDEYKKSLRTGIEDIYDALSAAVLHCAEQHADGVLSSVRKMHQIADNYSHLVGSEAVERFKTATRLGPNQEGSERFYDLLHQQQQSKLQTCCLNPNSPGALTARDAASGALLGAITGFYGGCFLSCGGWAGGLVGSGLAAGACAIINPVSFWSAEWRERLEMYRADLQSASELTLALGEFKQAYIHSLIPGISQEFTQKAKAYSEAMLDEIIDFRITLDSISIGPQSQTMVDDDRRYEPPPLR